MEQRKRPGGNGGAGKYTSWEKGKTNLCIYCGAKATTREHIPSKTFLQKPFPQNLPTIPACFECNNGFSKDEQYISCFLDKLKNLVYPQLYTKNDYVSKLERDKQLRKTLDKEIEVKENKIYYKINENRLARILMKLAKGHAGYEVDYLNFDDLDVTLEYEFVFNLSQETLIDFETIHFHEIAPEVGSRGNYIIQNIVTGEAAYLSDWKEVQDNQYRYQVLFNDGDGYIVKIIMSEFLYAKIYLN